MSAVINKLLWYVTTFLGWVLKPVIQWVFSKVYDRTSQTVPPIQEPLLLTSATKLAKKIREKKASHFNALHVDIPLPRWMCCVWTCTKHLLNVKFVYLFVCLTPLSKLEGFTFRFSGNSWLLVTLFLRYRFSNMLVWLICKLQIC